MQTLRIAFVGLLAVGSAAAAACSSTPSGSDGGTDTGTGSDSPTNNTFNQTGTVVDYSTKAGLIDMVVSGGGSTVGTDSKGNYTLPVPKNAAYTMSVTSAEDAGAAYLKLDEQEWMLSADTSRGSTSAVSNGTESLLKSILQPAPDPTLAVLTVQIYATGACPTATGATVSVAGLPAADAGASDAGGGIHLDYFSGGFPSTTATSVTDGQLPSAIIWNLAPNASFKDVTVTPPAGCTVKAFPTSDPSTDSGPGPTLVYTGNVKLEPSLPAPGMSVASFMRVFLQ